MRIAIILLSLLSSPVMAQQLPTATEMRGAATALAAQLEAIRDMHMRSEMKAAALAEENAKLKAQIQDLEKKAGQSPKD